MGEVEKQKKYQWKGCEANGKVAIVICNSNMQELWESINVFLTAWFMNIFRCIGIRNFENYSFLQVWKAQKARKLFDKF